MQLYLFVDRLLVRARGSRMSTQDTHGNGAKDPSVFSRISYVACDNRENKMN